MIASLFVTALATEALYISNVAVIEPGAANPMAIRSVLIHNGKFQSLTRTSKLPKSIRRIDGKGKFLIPGLWDMHVHWYDQASLGLFTANGVTGIRVMFGNESHKTWRSRANSANWTGPRVMTAGPIVDGKTPYWPGSLSIDDPEKALEIVKDHKKGGWDFLKVYSLLRREPYFALMKAAKAEDLPTCGHVPYTVSLLESANAGHRSNEHLDGFMIDLRPDSQKIRESIDQSLSRGEPPSQALSVLATMPVLPKATPAAVAAYGAKLAQAGMWQCPTLVVSRAISHLDKPEFLSDPRLKFIPADTRTRWNPKIDARFKDYTDEDWTWARREYATKLSLIAPLEKAGTRFLAGTDCLNPYCFPGFSLHDELALMVEAGLTPSEALEAATVNPARYFGKEKEFGRIQPGLWADCVLLDKNPLADIRNTTSIRAVIQNGRLLNRVALDVILKKNVR